MIYSWKYQQRISANVAGKRFEELEKIHGEITPRIVLDDARDENAVLHPCFEWDDSKAAEAYRLNQAGMMIRALVVTIEKTETPTPTRAYVNVSSMDEKQGRFISVQAALSDEELRTAVLTRAVMELSQFRRKYEDLQELADVFKAVDKVVKRAKRRKEAAA